MVSPLQHLAASLKTFNDNNYSGTPPQTARSDHHESRKKSGYRPNSLTRDFQSNFKFVNKIDDRQCSYLVFTKAERILKFIARSAKNTMYASTTPVRTIILFPFSLHDEKFVHINHSIIVSHYSGMELVTKIKYINTISLVNLCWITLKDYRAVQKYTMIHNGHCIYNLSTRLHALVCRFMH